MNSIVIAGIVINAQDTRKVGDKSCREFTLGFPQVGDKPDGCIKVTTWGKLAETPIEEGAFVIVDGTLATHKHDGKIFTTITASSICQGAETVKTNRVVLVGRAGQDPDIKYFESASSKATTSIAVRKSRDEVFWFNVEAWSKQGETLSNYVRKGDLFGITASLAQESWKDKTTGEERSRFIVKVDRVELMPNPKRDAQPVAAGADIDF